MSKFKAGDKVKYIGEDNEGLYVTTKLVYTIKSDDGYYVKLNEIPQCHSYSPEKFALYVDKEKESTAKWLKENSWYIETGSPEKSELVQEWLFEHGYVWFIKGSVPSYLESKYLCNVCIDGSIIGDILQTSNSQHIHKDAQEIILEFQTTIKSVKLPAVETEQEKKIRELQETIDKASAQIKAIKEGM